MALPGPDSPATGCPGAGSRLPQALLTLPLLSWGCAPRASRLATVRGHGRSPTHLTPATLLSPLSFVSDFKPNPAMAAPQVLTLPWPQGGSSVWSRLMDSCIKICLWWWNFTYSVALWSSFRDVILVGRKKKKKDAMGMLALLHKLWA